MSIQSDELQTDMSDDQRRVVGWRFEQLEALGFNETEAAIMATCRDVDLGQVREMLRAGCRRDTLLRIVL
jgi:hypothetical protein